MIHETGYVISEGDAFGLVAYLLASAEVTLSEPDTYGTLRLVDAASRLLGAIQGDLPPERRQYYDSLQSEIDAKKVWIMSNRESYVEFLKDITKRVARELKNRSKEAW